MTTTTTTTVPSIYIHRAHSECNDPDVFKATFERVLGATGCVRSVDIVSKTDKNSISFVRAFIHFKFWPKGDVADRMFNELMADQRLTITYNHETNWFWRFCRSKLPARDDTNAPPRKRKSRKNHYDAVQVSGDVIHDGDEPKCAVSKNDDEYIETSKRRVSNKPAWMDNTNRAGDSIQGVTTLVDYVIPHVETQSDSDDNESFNDYLVAKVHSDDDKLESGECDDKDSDWQVANCNV